MGVVGVVVEVVIWECAGWEDQEAAAGRLVSERRDTRHVSLWQRSSLEHYSSVAPSQRACT